VHFPPTAGTGASQAKFQCYCEKNSQDLTAAIADGKSKIAQLESDIPAATAQRDQVVAELSQHKQERAGANDAVDAATSQRKTENRAYEDEAADLTSNLAALSSAITAIQKGLGGFLETNAAQHVVTVFERSDADDSDKQSVRAFFQSSTSQSSPQSGEIVGILKTMVDEMEQRRSEITNKENEAVTNYNELISAKNQEISAAQGAIEEKTARQGDLAVGIATMKNDLHQTTTALEQDTGYSADLERDCADKTREYDEIKRTRAVELVALADTIKVLNSDDALELFKKSLPGRSLLQLDRSGEAVKARALIPLRAAAEHYGNYKLNLLTLALQGRKGGFEQVLKQIDDMQVSLKQEQVDDDAKLSYCHDERDHTSDQHKELQSKLGAAQAQHSKLEEAAEALETEIKTLSVGIKELDSAVAEASEQRKSEHAEYTQTAAENSAALELLEFAKNRLNKFYNPAQYVPPTEHGMSAEEKVEESLSFVQVSSRAAPPAFGGGAGKKSESGGGVVGMIEKIRSELKLEMNEDRLEEEDAQKDYEKLMASSAAKRSADVQTRSGKEAALADTNGDLLDTSESIAGFNTDISENRAYSMTLHATCDFLVENYETRKTARTEESEALEKAKAILSGADFSFLQTGAAGVTVLSQNRDQSCSSSDLQHRRAVQSKLAFLQGFCEDMCRVVGKHPDCAVCDGFIPPDATPGVMSWDELYAQFDKLKIVGRDHIKEWTGDQGKFGR